VSDAPESRAKRGGVFLSVYKMNHFVERFRIFLMIPLVCYYGLWRIQAVNVQGDSLFNRGATISLCVEKRGRYTETI
jgi:hypothetical protein